MDINDDYHEYYYQEKALLKSDRNHKNEMRLSDCGKNWQCGCGHEEDAIADLIADWPSENKGGA